MSGSKILVDTNVIIYHLNGNKDVELLLQDNIIYISSITYTELLSNAATTETENQILQEYLKNVLIVHTNDFICELAAELRKESRLKLPGALIAATCFFLNVPLITFDNDFEKVDDLRILKLTL